MSSRNEKDRAKQIQEKCQTILDKLLKDEDNKYCVDCDAKGPRWASWNLGIFLCIRCAGIHRNLGVHISKVKSVNLDSWTPEQVVTLQQMGNSRARAVYEANLPDAFRRPQTDSALEAFIRAKYEHRKYVAREWVPPSPPQVNWDKEIDEEMEKQKKRKKASSTTLSSASIPSPSEKKNTKSSEVPQPLPKPKSSASPKPGRATPKRDTSGTADLLGSSLSAANDATKSQPQVEDVFSSFLSAPQPSSDTNKNIEQNKPVDLKTEEESFFNQPAPSEKEKSKMTKDSILALYSQGPAQNLGNQPFPSAVTFNTQFPGQMLPQQSQFPQAQTSFTQGFGNFQVSNSTYPASQNGAMPQSNLAGIGSQSSNFGNFTQFPNNTTFNQFPVHQQTFGQQQNTFSSMPVQFPQQAPTQFPNLNGFQTTPASSQNGSNLNGQFFNTQPSANNLPQQFGNMSLGHQANSFSGPQSLTGVFASKTQTTNMAANSVWQ